MKDIKLVGARHGASVSTLYGVRQFEAAPPPDIYDIIAPASRVGVELLPGQLSLPDQPTDEELSAMIDRERLFRGDGFFRAFGEKAVTLGHIIIPLSDTALAGKQLRAARKAESLMDLRERSDQWLSRRNERRLRMQEALVDYLNVEGHEAALFEAIAREKPDVAVLALSRSQKLYRDPSLQKDMGIRISSYHWTEPYDPRHHTVWDSPLPSTLHEPTQTEIDHASQVSKTDAELIRRRHTSYMNGRVLPKDAPHPNLIGIYSLADPPEESLFELHFTTSADGTMDGMCYDLLGDAVIRGQCTPETIFFEKSYISERSSPITGPSIYYRGIYDPTSSCYQGRWDTSPESVKSGARFAISRFDPHPKTHLQALSAITQR